MAARLGKTVRVKKTSGRTKIEPSRKRRSVSQAIGAEKKAKRAASAWTKAAKGKATVRKAR